MPRINHGLFRKRHKLLLNGAHDLRHASALQIRSSHGHLEEGIPGKYDILIWEIVAAAPLGMSRRKKHTDMEACKV